MIYNHIVESQFYVRKVIVLAVPRERCVFYVDRVWTSTRGRGGSAHVDRGESGQKRDFFVDIINGWPPNSSDLTPVDYSIWSALQQWVYREQIVNVKHLKRVIIRCWTEISQELVNGAIDQRARHIDAVIRARGRHIEHLFD